MSDIALLLGPVAFQDFELPANITFGGEQRLAVHRLAGGGRVIDTLGRDDAEITFSGIFSGPDATLRARTLDGLRAGGTPLPLTWDIFFYTVVIRCFEADYRTGWWIPYHLACTVLRDEAGALIEAAASSATSVVADIGLAAGMALGAGVDLSGPQASITAPNALTRGTSAYGAAQASLLAGRSTLDSSIGNVGASLTSAAQSVGGAQTALDAIAGINNASTSAGQLGALTTARAYVGRAAANLANASS
jgi:hypothetical protein